jgi:hypothetical protein
MLILVIVIRHRPFPPPNNPHASRIPLPPCTLDRQPLPPNYSPFPRVRYHAPRVVRHRGHSLQLLRLQPVRCWRAQAVELVTIQHVSRAVSAGRRERVLVGVEGEWRGEQNE